MELLISNGANSNFINSKGNTALMYSCQEGHRDVSELLIRHSNTINNNKNHAGMTALMFASLCGHQCIVKLLLGSGSLPDKGDTNGSTALMMVSRNGHTACVEALLFAGAEVFCRNCVGCTAIDSALDGNHLALLSKLNTQSQLDEITIVEHKSRSILLSKFRTAALCGKLRLSDIERRCHPTKIRWEITLFR